MPLLWLSLAFIAGLLLGANLQLSWSIWLGIASFGILFAFFLRLLMKSHPKSKHLAFAGILLCSLALGALRFQHALPAFSTEDIAYYNDRDSLILEGIIISPPEQRSNYATARLKAEYVLDNINGEKWQAVNGQVQINFPASFSFTYGDRLLLKGALIPTVKSDQPPYASWLARRGIFSRIYFPQVLKFEKGNGNLIMCVIYRLRTYAHETLIHLMPHPESSLLSGILLGIESNIPDYLQSAYRVTGMAHIIAISGFNIALIAGLVTRLTNRLLPHGWGALLAITIIIFYTLLVGAQPAVVRAAIMGSLTIPAYLLGRKVIGVHSLTLAAALMAFCNPFILWDLGFQLSFAATFGILTFVNPLTEYFESWLSKHPIAIISKPTTRFISEFMFTTLAAQFAIFPLVITHFKDISLLSLPANLLILPIQPLVMMLGGTALLSGMVFLPLGKILGALAWLPIAFTNQVVLFFAMIPVNITLDSNILFWLTLCTLILTAIPAIRYQFKCNEINKVA